MYARSRRRVVIHKYNACIYVYLYVFNIRAANEHYIRRQFYCSGMFLNIYLFYFRNCFRKRNEERARTL